jgi:hypothetical protein
MNADQTPDCVISVTCAETPVGKHAAAHTAKTLMPRIEPFSRLLD